MIVLCKNLLENTTKSKSKKIIRQFIELIDNASNLKIKYVVLPLVDNGSLKNIYQKKN